MARRENDVERLLTLIVSETTTCFIGVSTAVQFLVLGPDKVCVLSILGQNYGLRLPIYGWFQLRTVAGCLFKVTFGLIG